MEHSTDIVHFPATSLGSSLPHPPNNRVIHNNKLNIFLIFFFLTNATIPPAIANAIITTIAIIPLLLFFLSVFSVSLFLLFSVIFSLVLTILSELFFATV